MIDIRQGLRDQATTVLAQLTQDQWRTFTTNFVVAETHALVLSRLGRHAARAALARLDRGTTVVVRVEAADERRAREIIDRYDDKDFSLVDALSFAVMEWLEIATAFAFDRHFAPFGWTVLGAPDG